MSLPCPFKTPRIEGMKNTPTGGTSAFDTMRAVQVAKELVIREYSYALAQKDLKIQILELEVEMLKKKLEVSK